MKNPFRNIFSKKSVSADQIPQGAPINSVPADYRAAMCDIIRSVMYSPVGISAEYGKINDGLSEFFEFAEVFFPIDFIASRIAGAHYEIRKVSDDSLVWCTGRSYKAQKIAKILSRPNCLQSFYEFVYTHFVNRLASGNAFVRSAMPSALGSDAAKWMWCDNLWSIPSSLITIETAQRMPLFGVCDQEDIIKGYRLSGVTGGDSLIPAWQIWHDKDTMANLNTAVRSNLLTAPSRLNAAAKSIGTLRKVYDARNIIYGRCGAIGIISNKTRDDAGSVPMKPSDKKELLKAYTDTYGVTGDKSPVIITDADVSYQAMGHSIASLQPFEETLLDAITIAGLYGIPGDLVPRKDKSTFSNLAASEKAVYAGVIIPMAEAFCKELTEFLGTESAGYYISCNFNGVDCLQEGLEKAENVKRLVNERCRQQFYDGLISYNDWRAQIHESALEGDVYNKTRYEMTDAERAFMFPAGAVKNTKISQNNETDTEEPSGSDQDQ